MGFNQFLNTRAFWLAAAFLAVISLGGVAPARAAEADAEKPLPSSTEAALILKEIAPEAPVYIRVFKEESELEVWKARPNGRYALVKTFPVCNWGGTIGPKQTKGDYMSPEGFYGVTPSALNPNSKYHLSFNIGYPNALDRALGRTGSAIMVHGNCVSVGCFAMTDAQIEEIYAFVRDAIAAGEPFVPVHVFPFRMTAANMRAHSDNAARASWEPLKSAFDDFATTRDPPKIGMCGKRYVVNSIASVGMDPNAACPALIGKRLAPMSPRTAKKIAKADPGLEGQGQKMKNAQTADSSITSFLASTLFGSGSASPSSSPSTSASASAADTQPVSDDSAAQPLLRQ